MFLMLRSSPTRLCRFLSNLPTRLSSKGARPRRAALQAALPAQRHRSRVLALFLGGRIAVRRFPCRYVDNPLSELVGVPREFWGVLSWLISRDTYSAACER